jgi:small ligand-binding sensory domain FIST
MIRAGAGHSNDADGMRAVDTALSEAMSHLGGDSADVAFLFATYHHMSDAAAMVDVAIDRAGTDVVAGCSAMGVMTDARENDREPGVAVLVLAGDQMGAIPIVAEGDDAGRLVGERVLPYSDEYGLLVLMPGVTSNPVTLIDQVGEMAGNVPIVGGLASGNPWAQESPRTLQWCGEWIGENGIAGVFLTGIKVATGVAQGCQPFGQAYAVTQAEGNVIHQIAFVPAVDALKEALDTLPAEEKAHLQNNIFVGLAMDEYATERGRGDFLIRGMWIDERSGAIAINEHISVGQTVQFNRRTPDAAHEDIVQVMQDLRQTVGRPSHACGLYFNCTGRGFGLYEQPDHDLLVIRKHLGSFPMAGFFGNSELAPVGGRNFVHSFTGALALLWEEE